MENTTIILYTVLTFILTFVFLSGHGRCRRRRQPHPLPPTGPLPLPIIGHLYLLKQNPHQILATISSNHGPILLLSFGTYPVLLVSSPAIAEECFTKNDIIFANRPQLLAGVYLGYNHTTLDSTNYGPHWRNLRRIAAVEIFSPARISSLSSLRSHEVHHLLRDLYHHGSQEICMREKLSGLTLNVMAMMLIGKRYGGDDEKGVKLKRVIKEVLLLAGSSAMEDFLPFPKLVGFVSGLKRRLMRLEKEMDVLFQSLVDERRRRRSNCGSEEEKKKTVIDVLLEMQEMEPEYYTDVFIKGFLVTMIMAGTDTSAGTMEWAMALLLNHPETLNKARDEISMHVGHERLITDTDVPKLTHLHNIIKETLRLFPATPFLIAHESSEDCTLSGYHVPKGTMLLVNVYAMQKDPELWGDDPLKFMPERFGEGDHGLGVQVKGSSYRYMPFGAGRRRCPGESLAWRLMELTLGALIQCFEWGRVGEEMVDLSEGDGLTMPMAKPLKAICKPRSNMIHLLSQL